MNVSLAIDAPAGRSAARSILSLSLTALLAAITHAYDFGPAAFVAAAVIVLLLTALGIGVARTGRRSLAALYVLLAVWLIGGFGVVGGLWNHAVKVIACAVHGGALPPGLEGWFISPEPGDPFYETVGILTFAASLAAAVFSWRFVRAAAGRRGAKV